MVKPIQQEGFEVATLPPAIDWAPGRAPAPKARTALFRLAVALTATLWAPAVHALDPAIALWQYGHTAWRVEDGELPGVPTALTQTLDGYLWIGTNAGPVRFDGSRFRPLAAPDGRLVVNHPVTALLASRDGGLWIGTSVGATRWQNGLAWEFETPSRVNSIREDAGGNIWYSRSRIRDDSGPIGRVSGDRRDRFGAAQGLPGKYADQFVVARDGSLWIGTVDGLTRWDGKSTQTFHAVGAAATHDIGQATVVEIAPDGSVWVAFSSDGATFGLQHLVDGQLHGVPLPDSAGSPVHVQALLADRDGALWIGTTDRGLFRMRDGQFEHLDTRDGLSGDDIVALFEDVEGDVWIATNDGLDRLRDLRVASITMRDGLATNAVQSVAAAPDDSLWISERQAIERLRDGRIVDTLRVREAAAGNQFTRVFVDRSGRIWAGVDEDLAVLEGSHFRRIRRTDGSAVGVVTDIVQDTQGTIWATSTARNRPLVRVVDDRFAEATEFNIGERLLATADGALWGGIPGETGLLRLKAGHLDRFAYDHRATDTGPAMGLQNGPGGSVLAATIGGIAAWRDGHVRMLSTDSGLPCNHLFGLAVDHTEDIWLSSDCGIVRIPASEFDAWWSDPAHKVAVRTYDASDGAQAGATSFGTAGTTTRDGRIWFATGSRVQTLDPAHLHDNPRAPQVHVEAVFADHRRYDLGSPLRLGANPRELEIDYSASSLVAPNKVQFRYRLEGHDDAWREPGTRRDAIYTDLPPGHYRFHVVASNDDGVWNTTGTALDIEVPPTFFQTGLFAALCVTAAGLALWALVRLRIQRLRERLHAQMDERERIARELHDTVLQAAQGLVLLLRVKLGQLKLAEPDRKDVDSALDRAAGLVRESRDRIQELRVAPQPARHLFYAIAREGKALAAGSQTRFESRLHGIERTLDAGAYEEMRRIAGEALANAFKHAQASHVIFEMEVADRALTLTVRDDGIGLSAQDASAGAGPHWGIVGMRERARCLGAQLDIRSGEAGGTEVRVTITGSRVYDSPGWRRRVLRWWRVRHRTE